MTRTTHTPSPNTATPVNRLECGCTIQYFIDHDDKKVYGIARCLLHAAAPELLEALEAIEAGFADGSIQFTKPRKADSDPYHKANTLMCDALAKARGKE